MSLPISWVAAGAIPAAQALKHTVNLAATSASHLFGELLQTSPSRPNPAVVDSGRSEPIEPIQNPKPSNSQSLADRIESLRNYLSKFVNESRARYGLGSETGKTDSISISSNGKDALVLNGPEPSRTELESHLREHPAIVREINEVSLQTSTAAPLRLMPGSNTQELANPSWTLWLE